MTTKHAPKPSEEVSEHQRLIDEFQRDPFLFAVQEDKKVIIILALSSFNPNFKQDPHLISEFKAGFKQRFGVEMTSANIAEIMQEELN